MKDKIIILDVDGTLMPGTNELDLETTSYLKDISKNNLVVLASGRGYHELSIIHQSLGLNSPIISNNGGTLSFFDGHEDVVLSIDKNIIKYLFKNYKDIIISSFYSYENKLFIYNKMDKLNFLYKINSSSIVTEGSFDEIEIENPNSIYFVLDNNKKNIFYKEIDTKFNNEISYLEYGHDKKYSIVLLTLKNTNKAYAILELLLILNKKEEDLIIFGDSYQDLKMLSLNGLTVAMKNADIECKKVAKQITLYDNNNKGVLIHLKKIESELS